MEPDGKKEELRRSVLSARDGMTYGEQERATSYITSALLSLPEYESAQTILGYCSFGSEPGTWGFLRASLDAGKHLVLPRVEKSSGKLSLHRVSDLTRDLAPGIWGIMEPNPGLPQDRIEEVDFVLVPGVAFDRQGGRLGYGGGYYDRMLGTSTKKPTLIAAAFEVQLVERVPVEVHDVRVDGICTGNGIIHCGTAAGNDRKTS